MLGPRPLRQDSSGQKSRDTLTPKTWQWFATRIGQGQTTPIERSRQQQYQTTSPSGSTSRCGRGGEGTNTWRRVREAAPARTSRHDFNPKQMESDLGKDMKQIGVQPPDHARSQFSDLEQVAGLGIPNLA